MVTNLPKQLYTRGKQGTLVYSPDIAVFVKLTNDEILDLSPYIVDFNLGRVVNDVSSFSCSIDNKFGQFDRVIKRMDRIVVYLKRISWLQVFSGYVTSIPWQTVVPGNVTISAQCTIKRLMHNYFDQNNLENLKTFFPYFNQVEDWKQEDGGAAFTVARLLTKVVQWPLENIQIQKIPPQWSEDAAYVIQALVNESDGDSEFQSELKQIKDGLNSIIDSFGWSGYYSDRGKSMIEQWANYNNAGATGDYTEANWRKIASSDNNKLSGYVPIQYLFNFKANGLDVKGKYNLAAQSGRELYLRLDAADSLAQFTNAWIGSGKRKIQTDSTSINIPILASYLDFSTQDDYIHAISGGCINKDNQTVAAPTERFTGDLLTDYNYVKDVDSGKITETYTVGNPDGKSQKYMEALNNLQEAEATRLGLFKQLYWYYYTDSEGRQAQASWLGYPDYKFQITINNVSTDVNGTIENKNAFPIRCQNGKAGYSTFGWATAIKLDKSATEFYTFAKQNLPDYGWKPSQAGPEYEGPDVWIFTGNDKYPIYWDNSGRINNGGITSDLASQNVDTLKTYTGAYQNRGGQFPEVVQSTVGTQALFAVMFMGFDMTGDILSEALSGERSWINDVPVLELIKKVCPGSMRDFMSAPNGDFIAFIPDRIGRYNNFPTIQIRDIELLDFKAMANDSSLVTHYLSNADLELPAQTIEAIQRIYTTSAMMTVEQAPLMNFVLGLPLDQTDKEYGPRILQTFGLRPVVEDNLFIRNRAFNFTYALHKFQEMWANQWQFVVNLTFMPELYPGMRIELVDRTTPSGDPAPVAVYVESVSHSGSRSTGFNTTAVVSTPMIRLNGKWTQYRPEFGPVTMPDSADDVAAAQKQIQDQRMRILFNKNMANEQGVV